MNPISLLYHDVVRGDPSESGFRGADADSYKLDEANFIAHLHSVAEAAPARVRLIPPVDGFNRTPGSVIFLTFDDGGVSADEPTARLLESRGWRGHFFIVTQKIGVPGFLTADQIRDLFRRGHHIGSHSHSHPERLSELSYDKVLDEWRESRRILADVLGVPPVSVSVPGGFYSEKVARAAREAGYRVLFNSEPSCAIRRQGDLIILGRYGIKQQTTAAAAQALVRGDLAPRLRQAVLWNVKKSLKKAGGSGWLAFRRWFFSRRRRVYAGAAQR